MGPRRHARAGFTLIEVVVVGLLTALLAGILASAWSAFYRSAAEVAARGQLAQEADFAMAQLARDLAGDGSRRLVGIRVDSNTFDLCFDGPGDGRNGFPDWTGPDTVVTYRIATNPAGREELLRDGLLVARHAHSLRVFNFGETDWIQFDLTFRHPVKGLERVPSGTAGRRELIWLERTYSLIARVP